MQDIRIADDLWATRLMPEGLLEAWRVPHGARVERGDTVAEVEIEDCRHDILAPSSGRLLQEVAAGSLVEPGTVIARVCE